MVNSGDHQKFSFENINEREGLLDPDEFDVDINTQDHSQSDLLPFDDVKSGNIENAPHLTLFSTYALIVGSIIGSGIFASPAQVDKNVPSPGVAVIIWIISGLIAWLGAASFAELGAAIPKNGGMQAYLHYIYGDLVASTMSWTWIIVVKPCAMAIMSLIFAKYWIAMVFSIETWSIWSEKLLALGTLGVMLAVNSLNSTSSTWLTDRLVLSKLFTVALVVVLAFLVMAFNLNNDGNGTSSDWKSHNWFQDPSSWEGSPDLGVDWTTIGAWDALGHFTFALYAGGWAYGGWDNANYVAKEMKHTARDLPRAIHTALPTVITSFAIIVLSYYIILPWDVVQRSNAVAIAVGRKSLGPFGGPLFGILVSISCLGSLNTNIYATGKLVDAAAELGYMPRLLHEHGHVPLRAMTMEAVIAGLYVLIGTFGPLLSLIGLIDSAFGCLTVIGALVLRWREPMLIRPYKPAIWIPIVFVTTSICLVLRGLLYAPAQGAALIAAMTVGICFRLYKARSKT